MLGCVGSCMVWWGEMKAPPHGNTYQEDVCAPTMVSVKGWGGPCRGEGKLGIILVEGLVCLAGPGPQCVVVDIWPSSCLVKGHFHRCTWP